MAKTSFGFGFMAILAIVLIAGVAFAQRSFDTSDAKTRLITGLNDLCVQLVSILPIIAILLFVLAAVIYGIGHIFGAEMRSKATGWATSMVVGAVISLLIFLLTRPVLSIFVPEIETSDFCKATFQ
jgi:drug/metabolite transporter (DMT)-like permease